MKYAVVTGGTSGMGLGVSKMLVEKGYYVFTTYVGPEFTEKIDNYEAHQVDQTKRNEVYTIIIFTSVSTKYNHLRVSRNKPPPHLQRRTCRPCKQSVYSVIML